MEPIINPWIVYIADRCETVRSICLITLVFGVIVLAIWEMGYLDDTTDIKPSKWLITAVIVAGIGSMFTPNKDTVLTMATLNYITEDNIKLLGETAEDVIDFVIDKVEEITDDD